MTPTRKAVAAPPESNQTGAMLEAVMYCNKMDDLKVLELLIGLIIDTGLFPSEAQRLIVMTTLGLEGQALNYARNFSDVAKIVRLEESQVTDRFNRAMALMHQHKLPSFVSYSWLREMMRTIMAQRERATKPSGQPANGQPAAPPQPRAVVSRNITVISQCVDESQRLYLQAFLRAVSALPENEQDTLLFAYGIEGENLVVPRPHGAIVGRLKRLRTTDDVQQFIKGFWCRSDVLSQEITDKGLRAHLAHIRAGTSSVPEVPAQPVPFPTPPLPPEPVAPPLASAPPAAAPSPVPTDSSSDSEFTGYLELLNKCSPKYRDHLEALLTSLRSARRVDREQLEAVLGLRDGTLPLTHEEYAPIIGIALGACSQRTSYAFHRLQAHGLSDKIDLSLLRSIALSVRGIRRRGVLFLDDAVNVDVSDDASDVLDTSPDVTTSTPEASATEETAPAATSEPTADAAAAPEPAGEVTRTPHKQRVLIGEEPSVAAALQYQEGLRHFWLTVHGHYPKRSVTILRLYYRDFLPVSTIAGRYGVSTDEMWAELRNIMKQLGIKPASTEREE